MLSAVEGGCLGAFLSNIGAVGKGVVQPPMHPAAGCKVALPACYWQVWLKPSMLDDLTPLALWFVCTGPAPWHHPTHCGGHLHVHCQRPRAHQVWLWYWMLAFNCDVFCPSPVVFCQCSHLLRWPGQHHVAVRAVCVPCSKYLVRASYLQIYNEVISDLLKV